MMVAAVDPVSLANLLLALLGGMIGGFFGALGYAYRRGRWEQRIESRQENIETAVAETKARLLDGDRRFDTLVRVERVAQELTGELQSTQRIIGELVTRRECETQHGALAKLCDERHRRIGDGPDRG